MMFNQAFDNTALPPVVVICGPTGVGKTACAIELARRFKGQIVGADSMQIYKYMDIGTAKPSAAERRLVPHHLIDIVAPDEAFSAGQYSRTAGEVIARLHDQGILPFLVGGTGLYIKACLRGLFREGPAAPRLLERLKAEAAEIGTAAMHQRLTACDPEAGRRISPNDLFRIIRALEVYEMTGRPASEHIRAHGFAQERYRTLKFCLSLERAALFQAIDARVDAMLAAGFADEVRDLLDKGYAPELKSMQSIGYRHMTGFLQGTLPWEEMRRTMQRDTRRYAKRQLTWFRGDPDLIWVPKHDGPEVMAGLIESFMESHHRG